MCQRILRLRSATFPFEGKWQRRECDNERAHIPRDLRDHRRRARARATAESSTNENQTCFGQRFADFIRRFLRGIKSKFGIAARAKPARNASGPAVLSPLRPNWRAIARRC